MNLGNIKKNNALIGFLIIAIVIIIIAFIAVIGNESMKKNSNDSFTNSLIKTETSVNNAVNNLIK